MRLREAHMELCLSQQRLAFKF